LRGKEKEENLLACGGRRRGWPYLEKQTPEKMEKRGRMYKEVYTREK